MTSPTSKVSAWAKHLHFPLWSTTCLASSIFFQNWNEINAPFLEKLPINSRNSSDLSVIYTYRCQYVRIMSNFTVLSKSVQFSHSVMSNSLRPHEPQHTRPPCPSPTPGVYSNPCLSSQWCHPTISSSVVPFSFCSQSFPASGSFQMSQLFASGGQSIGVSASTSVLPMNTQDWSPLGWTGWISLQSKGLSRVFSNTTVQKHQFFSTQLSYLSKYPVV